MSFLAHYLFYFMRFNFLSKRFFLFVLLFCLKQCFTCLVIFHIIMPTSLYLEIMLNYIYCAPFVLFLLVK